MKLNNSFLNSSKNEGSNSIKNRLKINSIRMYEAENSLVYPKKLTPNNLD